MRRRLFPITRVRTAEVLEFTPQEWQLLDDGGLETFDLPSDAVSEALAIKAKRVRLSANDLLLPCRGGPARRCAVADRRSAPAAERGEVGIEVHGVLWIIDLLHEAEWKPLSLLPSALETWRDDPAVLLPANEIDKRLRVLRRLVN